MGAILPQTNIREGNPDIHRVTALLEILLSTTSDLIFVIDRESRYLFASQTVADMLGRERQEIIGKTPLEMGMPADLVRQVARDCESVFSTGRSVWDDDVLLGRDSQQHYYRRFLSPLLATDGGVIAVVGTAWDITENRRAEQSLRLTEENLALAISAAHLGTFYCEWPFNKIVWNETCKQHFFLPLDAEVDFNLFYSLLHPEDRARTEAAIDQAIVEQGEYNIEYRVPAPDGQIRWIHAIGRGFYNDQGIPIRFDGITIDITERKQGEEERERLRRLSEARAVELAEVYQREHRIAEALQRSLLNKPHLSPSASIEIETIYKPALDEAEVGGDYYDVFALADGKLALVVGDVSGKGLQAASRTAEIKYTLRAYLREYPDAGSALQRLNSFLCESQILEEHTDDFFVCIVLILLDPVTGSAELAVGGAEPPVFLRAHGLLEEIHAGGLPLGISRDACYQTDAFTLSPGDLLLAVTDGITEARHGKEFLGWDGITRLVLDAYGTRSLHEMGQAVFSGAERFAGGSLKDDACLLLARRI